MFSLDFYSSVCDFQVMDEISDLTKDKQRVTGQIRNCDYKMHQATFRLDTLNQRPRYELCLDEVCGALNMVAVKTAETFC